MAKFMRYFSQDLLLIEFPLIFLFAVDPVTVTEHHFEESVKVVGKHCGNKGYVRPACPVLFINIRHVICE
jgi:hypothetical protein